LGGVLYVVNAWEAEEGESPDTGPLIPMVDSVGQLVAVRLGSLWLVVAWALDFGTPGLVVRVEGERGLDLEDSVDALPGGVWDGLPGRVLTGYDLVWHDAADGEARAETVMALRLVFGDDLVTIMLGVIREHGRVDYSVDDLLVVRGLLGDSLVDGFLERWFQAAGPEGLQSGGKDGGSGPWGELADADALWDTARRRVLAGAAEDQLRRGLSDRRGSLSALTILLDAPLDLVEHLFPAILEWVMNAAQRGGFEGLRTIPAAIDVLGRLPTESLKALLTPHVDAVACDPSAPAGLTTSMAWLLGRLGLGELSQRLAECHVGQRGGERRERPVAGPDADGDDRSTRGSRPWVGGLPAEPWADAAAAQELFDDVLLVRILQAGRDAQFGLGLRDAGAAPAVLRVLLDGPPYWTQAVFGDVLGWALGSSDLVGPAREAIRRLPRDWVRFELSGRVADLAKDPGPDPDPGWEARTRMGQLLGFLGEEDLLAVLRRGSEAPGASSGGGGAAGTGGGG
jgi:hypothetical protein